MKEAHPPRNERAFEALRLLLEQMHPRDDTTALLKTLQGHFQSADALFSADGRVLERLGVRKNDALLLSHMTDLARYLKRMDFDKRPNLSTLAMASPYLVANFHGLQMERFYMFCLDVQGRLKRRILLQEGTADSTLFSLKRMLSEVVQCAPRAVIFSHNHPGHTLRPSQDDLNCTCEAIRALTVVGIPLLDHVIIAGSRAVSMRANGFIPAGQWLSQCPGSRLLQGWLEGADAMEHP